MKEEVCIEYNISKEQSYSVIVRYILWSIIVFFILCQFFVNFHNDGKAMLSFSLEFERSGNLYDRSFDFNAPLIFIIHTVTAFFISNSNISPRLIFHSYNLFLCLIGYLTLFFSIRKTELPRKEQNLILDMYAFVIVVAPSFASNWGERDHLLFVFSLPWIIQILWRQKPTLLSTILAGAGFCIRPHNAIIPIAIMFFEFIRRKNIKKTILESRILTIAGVYIFYISFIIIYHPTYWGKILYVSLLTYPSVIPESYYRMVIVSIYSFLIFSILYFMKNSIKYLYELSSLTLSCILWYSINQAWSYTKIALIIPLFILFIIFFFNEKSFLKKISFIPIVLYFSFISFSKNIDDLFFSRNEDYVIFKDFLNNSNSENLSFKEEVIRNAGEKFVLLSIKSWGSHFVRLGKTHHEYAFDWLWPLPWAYDHQTDPRSVKIRSLMADYLIQALERRPAPTLLIDRSPEMRGVRSSSHDRPAIFLEEFLAQDNQALKDVLKKYALVKTIDDCKKGEDKIFSCRIDVFKAN